MKKSTAICAVAAAILTVSHSAHAAIETIPFTDVINGVVSYDHSGDNVVQAGTEFWDANETHFYTGTPDSMWDDLTGNFGLWAKVRFTDPDDSLATFAANPNLLYSWVIEGSGILFDETSDMATYFGSAVLDATGWDEAGLFATPAQLDAGYVKVANADPDVWLDISVASWSGAADDEITITIVMDNWAVNRSGMSDFDAVIQPGTLGAGSGITATLVPEPASLMVWGLLSVGAASMAAGTRRKRRAVRWSDENRQAIRSIIERGR